MSLPLFLSMLLTAGNEIVSLKGRFVNSGRSLAFSTENNKSCAMLSVMGVLLSGEAEFLCSSTCASMVLLLIAVAFFVT